MRDEFWCTMVDGPYRPPVRLRVLRVLLWWFLPLGIAFLLLAGCV